MTAEQPESGGPALDERGRLVGVLDLQSTAADAFTPQDQALLKKLGLTPEGLPVEAGKA